MKSMSHYGINKRVDTSLLLGVFLVICVVLILAISIYKLSDNFILSGEIAKKSYTPAHTSTHYRKSEINGETVRIPYNVYNAERFSFSLTGTNDAGEKQYGWVDVPQDIWQTAKIGDYYNNDCVCLEPQ